MKNRPISNKLHFMIILATIIFIVTELFSIYFISNSTNFQEEKTTSFIESVLRDKYNETIQIIKNAAEYFYFSNDTNLLLTSDNISEKKKSIDSITDASFSILKQNDIIKGIYLIDLNKNIYTIQDGSNGYLQTKLLVYLASHETNELESLSLFKSDDYNMIVSTQPLTHSETNNIATYRNIGYLIFTISPQSIYKDLRLQNELLNNSKISIIDENNNDIRLSPRTDFTHYNTISVDFNKFMIKIDYPIYTTFIIAKQYLIFLLISTLSIIILMLILSHNLTKNISQPIDDLINQVKTISTIKTNKLTKIESDGELPKLSQTINRMLITIREETELNELNLNKLYNMRLKSEKAMYYALQNQINPHFMYNTLQCIRGLALENSIPAIADISTNMSSIFQYTLKGNRFVRLKKEIDILNKFIYINKVRYEDKYKFIVDISDNILNAISIKMYLQPLVENSIKYGLFKGENGGFVKIKGYKKNDRIYIFVTNSGAPISKTKATNINTQLNENYDKELEGEHKSIGLMNISNRFRELFTADFHISIHNCLNKTYVELAFPYLENIDE